MQEIAWEAFFSQIEAGELYSKSPSTDKSWYRLGATAPSGGLLWARGSPWDCLDHVFQQDQYEQNQSIPGTNTVVISGGHILSDIPV
jgi:hypothetical protein